MFEYPYLVYLFGFILSEASKLIDFLFSDIYLKGFPYFFSYFLPSILDLLLISNSSYSQAKFCYTKMK